MQNLDTFPLLTICFGNLKKYCSFLRLMEGPVFSLLHVSSSTSHVQYFGRLNNQALATLFYVWLSRHIITYLDFDVKACFYINKSCFQRFEPHLGHNLLSCGVFLVKSRHFGLPLVQTLRPNWQSLLAGGSVDIQTWSIYKVYT